MLPYLLPIAVVLAIYIAHLVRRHQMGKRIKRWAENREALSDEAFYIALNLPVITKDAAISVRATVSGAVRIPRELIRPNDGIRELEEIGDPSHPSTVDYFEDMWSVVSTEGDPQLLTVRDLVIEFGPKTK